MRDSLGNLSLLQRICTVVVLLCFVHISVTLLYYLRTLDLRGSFLQNQQANSPSPNEAKEPAGVTEAHRLRSALGSNVSGEAGGGLEPCPERSPLLVGPLRIEFSNPVSLDLVRSENPRLSSGGRYKPTDCIALQKVAMIIPFRNRDEHLKFWLYYLHPILQRQQLDYGVYIINQQHPPPYQPHPYFLCVSGLSVAYGGGGSRRSSDQRPISLSLSCDPSAPMPGS